jgi:hypothetical protein
MIMSDRKYINYLDLTAAQKTQQIYLYTHWAQAWKIKYL